MDEIAGKRAGHFPGERYHGGPSRHQCGGCDQPITYQRGAWRNALNFSAFCPAGDHRVISLDGWTCDECGQPVNGQTDEDGNPAIRGDNVHHV